MTDSATASGSTGRTPPPTFFDPSFERLPASAAFDEAHPGPVVLLYDPRSDREWAADAAVALATGWTAGGRRTVLADLSLDDPFLHDRIGMGNLDGVVDIFLYGASLARSARPVPGRGFYLITAGTYTPDAGAILRHPRWAKLVAGFREAQASLLLFVPADAPELAALRAWAKDAILLGDRGGEAAFGAALAQGFAPRAWLIPPAFDAPVLVPPAAAAPAPAPERFPAPEPAASVAPWNAPPREAPRAPAELPGAQAAVGAPAAALPVPDPTWEEEALPPKSVLGRRKKRKVSPLMLVLLVILLIALAVVVALTYFPDAVRALRADDDSRPRPAAGATPAPRPRAAAAARPTQPAGTPRPYAVFVKAYDAFVPAHETAQQVAARVGGQPVYVIPEQTSGVMYHKVFAGMMGDTAEAARLRDQLVQDGTVNPEDVGGPSALVQPRPLAFDLGDFATREEARARAAQLAEGAIPAYPAPVPQTDGSERWRLYGGAFADSASAIPMQRMLEQKGLPARLVQRTGRPPASPK